MISFAWFKFIKWPESDNVNAMIFKNICFGTLAVDYINLD